MEHIQFESSRIKKYLRSFLCFFFFTFLQRGGLRYYPAHSYNVSVYPVTENPTHQGAHVLPSTLVISLLLIIIVLLTIYCLR